MGIQRKIITAVGGAALTLAVLVSLQPVREVLAASVVAAYWGGASGATNVDGCLTNSYEALVDQRFQVFDGPWNGDVLVQGYDRTKTLVVTVVCIPQGQRVVFQVLAYSNDGAAARGARDGVLNRLREKRAVAID